MWHSKNDELTIQASCFLCSYLEGVNEPLHFPSGVLWHHIGNRGVRILRVSSNTASHHHQNCALVFNVSLDGSLVDWHGNRELKLSLKMLAQVHDKKASFGNH